MRMLEEQVGEVGDRASEIHIAGWYQICFTVGSLARLRAMDGTWGPGIL